ncbi:DUF1491 family protein [Pseudahrensia aquimaris]|uniref:DUF1491 family protein n=1 Tax=Pseudahrensia aquimaris TaxID=744461 RepID=A0ABW3FGB6_9HYPH
MRITSEIFISALRRRAESAGAFVMVLAKGEQAAGAIYIVVRRAHGKADLVGPAPQSYFDDMPNDRRFETLLSDAEMDAVQERLDREKQFDPDVWIIEIDDRQGRCFVDLVDI